MTRFITTAQWVVPIMLLTFRPSYDEVVLTKFVAISLFEVHSF